MPAQCANNAARLYRWRALLPRWLGSQEVAGFELSAYAGAAELPSRAEGFRPSWKSASWTMGRTWRRR